MLQAQRLDQQVEFANAARFLAQLPVGRIGVIGTKPCQHLVQCSGNLGFVGGGGHDCCNDLHGRFAGVGVRGQAARLGQGHLLPYPRLVIIIGLQPLAGLRKRPFFTVRTQACINLIQAAFTSGTAQPADKGLGKAGKIGSGSNASFAVRLRIGWSVPDQDKINVRGRRHLAYTQPAKGQYGETAGNLAMASLYIGGGKQGDHPDRCVGRI